MRFIVDVYRYIILGGIAALIIALVFVTLKISSHSAAFGAMFFVYFAVAVLVTVFGLGITATFISIHDRHAEIVDELRAMREERRER